MCKGFGCVCIDDDRQADYGWGIEYWAITVGTCDPPLRDNLACVDAQLEFLSARPAKPAQRLRKKRRKCAEKPELGIQLATVVISSYQQPSKPGRALGNELSAQECRPSLRDEI